ncbi:protein rolling stone-like [Anopheles bellator]|uniref:protein rolling stone-like n=1 Tax=Anopheles bellator TaxID=139047 RepID=UPI002647AA4C|nr:protein rolling stone-like [Anopheles bellator]XP_058059007.1 protein rolling stone-like [Anopheles bellator]
MPGAFVESCKNELKVRNCGFAHLPAEEFVKSQWQTRTKSIFFLLYRMALAIFFTGVVINSMVVAAETAHFGKYFIYLTHWGILLCMVTTVMGAVLVKIWYFHPEYSETVCGSDEMPTVFKFYWMLHNITLVLSICITIIYWAILHNDTMTVDANNILIHACNCVFMFLDLIIVAYPVRLWHVVQPIAFGLIYCTFSVIYHAAGGTDLFGRPYIYNVLDWSEPGKAMVTVVGTILLAMLVHILMFAIYKLRVKIYSRYFGGKPIIPTNSTLQLQTGKVDRGISMVYGNDNKGFTIGERY